MQTRLGSTQYQQTYTLLISGICSSLVALIASFCWDNTLLLALYLSLTTFIAIYLSVLGENIAIASFFINLFAIMSGGLITTNNIERSMMIIIGTFIALLTCLLWPTRPKNNFLHALKIYYLSLAEFCEKFTITFSQKDYLINKIKFEKLFHERRNRTLRLLNKTRHNYHLTASIHSLSPSIQNKYDAIIDIAEQLFESIIALGNLRHRLINNIDHNNLRDDINIIYLDIANRIRAVVVQQAPQQTQSLTSSILHLQTAQLSDQDLKAAIMDFTYSASKIVDILNHISTLEELEIR